MSLSVPYGFVYGKRGSASPEQSSAQETSQGPGNLQTFTKQQMQAEIAAFRDAHRKSDVDFSPSSLHHTLGNGPGQAASGQDLDAIKTGYTTRIATTKVTSNSGVFSAETVVITCVGFLEIGRTYKVETIFLGDINTAGDEIVARIREDSLTGTVMWDHTQAPYGVTRASRWNMWNEFTAIVTGSKTFVVTLARLTGTGTIGLIASASQPAFLVIDQTH